MIKPKFSVAIALAPYRNAEVLKSLGEIDYPKDRFEIIIKKGFNPSENRNNCAAEAKGEILAFIDDDAIVDKNILRNAEEFFDKHPEIDIVGGPQLTPENDKFFARASGFALESYFGSFKMRNRYTKGRLNLNADELSLTSANCFMRKSSFDKTAGYNTNLFPGEDPEFFARVKISGQKIAYNPELIIYHRRRPSIKSFGKQVFKYGEVCLPKEKYNNRKASPIFFFPIAFVFYIYALPFTFILTKLALIPLLIYILFAVSASIDAAIEHRSLLAVFALPFIFLFMHMSYGLGMLKSIVKRNNAYKISQRQENI